MKPTEFINDKTGLPTIEGYMRSLTDIKSYPIIN